MLQVEWWKPVFKKKKNFCFFHLTRKYVNRCAFMSSDLSWRVKYWHLWHCRSSSCNMTNIKPDLGNYQWFFWQLGASGVPRKYQNNLCQMTGSGLPVQWADNEDNFEKANKRYLSWDVGQRVTSLWCYTCTVKLRATRASIWRCYILICRFVSVDVTTSDPLS